MPSGWGEALTVVLNLGGLGVGLGITIIVIAALIRGDLVPGYIYRQVLEDRADARKELNDARAKDEAAETAARIAEQAAAAVLRVQQLGRAGAARDADESG